MILSEGLHRSYSANTRGRDFVIGDIHGDLIGLEAYLDRVSFDKNIDRLFCCGDLVDRGLNSYELLMLARDSDWFIPVLGNHEMIVYSIIKSNMHKFFGEDVYLQKDERGYDENLLNFNVSNNGSGWLLFLSDIQLRDVLDAIESLPFSIDVVGSDGSLYGILHTDPLGSWDDIVSLSKSSSHTDLLLGRMGGDSDLQSMLWGRSLAKMYVSGTYKYAMSEYNISGVKRVYLGHTVLSILSNRGGVIPRKGIDFGGIHSIGSITFLDTGAWFMGDGSYTEVML